MSDSGSNEVRDLFDRYVRFLDDERYDEWLDLFSADAYYGVITHRDWSQGTNYVIVGERKPKLAERFHYSYGPGGRIGLDDVRVFEHCQRGLRANGRDLLLARGIDKPGDQGGAADEHNIRNFWSTWSRYMSAPDVKGGAQ